MKNFINAIKISLILFLLSPGVVKAQSMVDALNPNCRNNGDCSIEDFFRLIIAISGRFIALSGVLALVAFVYGGIVFLTSAGSSDRVTKGKKIVIGSLIGLAIVFLSYTIITFIARALGVDGFQMNTNCFRG